ncbi:hypothetical protein GJ744_000911 [Endocarpon pusillum]|uniref:Uncharacterized protein n=1 Tax=Endocarpon pusillum TaxID=364733 RepID=A0A8H7E8S6_9EURO|nr:hypothetical protein GJ744_000911 [Endocarpon pusillum]
MNQRTALTLPEPSYNHGLEKRSFARMESYSSTASTVCSRTSITDLSNSLVTK